jgi:adenosine kinase
MVNETAGRKAALVCGSVAYDTILVFPDRFQAHLLPDKLHMLNVSFLVPEMRREFGGCAANIAYGLHLLGDAGLAMATVGDDFEPYRRRMLAKGINVDCIKVVDGTFTAQAFITTDIDHNQINAFHPGAMQYAHLNTISDAAGRGAASVGVAARGVAARGVASRGAAERGTSAGGAGTIGAGAAAGAGGAIGAGATGAGAAADAGGAIGAGTAFRVVLGVVAPDGRQGMIEHAAQFSAAEIPFIFDPGQGLPMFGAEELAVFIDQATWVAVNDYEWEVMQQKTGMTAAEIVAKVDALIVTRGPEGSTIYTQERAWTIPAVKPRAVVDPTGCGDAYRAGLIHGLLQGLDWETTGRMASLMGSIKIESRGPQNHDFTKAEFDRRYQDNFG